MARRSDDDEPRGRVPWIRGGGWALTALAVVLRVLLPRGSELRLAALVLIGVGLVLVFVGEARARRAEVDDGDDGGAEPDAGVDSPSARTARLALAGIGGALVLGGLVWVTVVAYAGRPASSEWGIVVAGTVALVVAAIWWAAVKARPARLVERAPSKPRARVFVLGAVSVLLLAQAAAPMRYYLGDDLFDERFSWRMFSAVRVYRCRLEAYETPTGGAERPTELMSVIHEAWVNTMRRNREDVLRRYLEWRCEGGEVEAARLVNRCQTPEGNAVPDEVRTIDCAEGVVVDPSEGLAIEVHGGAP